MTRLDMIAMALRRLGVVASDEALTAEQHTFGSDMLESIYAELEDAAGDALTWDLDTVPDKSARLLANLLAVEFGPHYMVPPPETRGMAWLRLMGSVRPDDRAEIADPAYY